MDADAHNESVNDWNLGHYLQLGTTIDDAIGEAYDKTSRWLGLDMGKGGGPALEELALEGDASSINFSVVLGGAASNKYVRARLRHVVETNDLQLICPPSLFIDNGVMIAWTGIEHFLPGRFDPPPPADEPNDAMMFDMTKGVRHKTTEAEEVESSLPPDNRSLENYA
ncbi:putative tRNA N6-adenosine threonylcarbamoyltransferase, mitochondrial [Canna indica]|uniref:tRNA N6-adenosine threonylcarbamoyltransferase, mitochondrial n=1 Tax=Canna indica TaxID=4628 RepID=A0AAQ3JX34_9LILI|nr:putative tRNA N6-adenosine threonylcarbamoyltransferase, mitochondrial [Canna indica]